MSIDTEDTDKHKVEETAGFFHTPNPKQIMTIMRVSEILMKNSRLMKSMMMIEDHTNHWIRTVMTTGPNQDHQRTTHTEKDTDITLHI